VVRGLVGSALRFKVDVIVLALPKVVSVSPARVAIDSHALMTVNGVHFDSCLDLKCSLGKPCSVASISDTLAVFSCFAHANAELGVFCNDRIIFSSVNIVVKSPSIVSLIPSDVFLGINQFQIVLSNDVLDPRVTLNNNTCGHVVSNMFSLTVSCLIQEVHGINRFALEIPNSNIPPIITILRSHGMVVSSVSPSVFFTSQAEIMFVHGVFPNLDVLASCWFGSRRTFLQVKSSSLASCEVPDGIFGNISVTITDDYTQFSSSNFFVQILKQIVVSMQPSLSVESGGDLITCEGLLLGYSVQINGQAINISVFSVNSVGFVSPALSPGLHLVRIMNHRQIFVAETTLYVVESLKLSVLRAHPPALEVGIRMITIYGKNFHAYKDVHCESLSICSVQSSHVLNSEMLYCQLACFEAGEVSLFLQLSPSSRIGPLLIHVLRLPSIKNVIPASISQFNQTFSVIFSRHLDIKFESLVCVVDGTTFESQVVGLEAVCSCHNVLRSGSFDVFVSMVYRSCKFDIGASMPIVISNLRPSVILSVYPLLVPAGEIIQFTVIGEWEVSPSYCVFGTVLKRSNNVARNKISCDFEFSTAPDSGSYEQLRMSVPKPAVASLHEKKLAQLLPSWPIVMPAKSALKRVG
jgi:hypothetical protein